MSLSGIAKFILGFFLGIFLLASSGAATAFYLWTKLSAIPPKPIFAEEQQKASPAAKKTNSLKASKSQASKQPTPRESPRQELPPGAYKARVSWQEGLIVRAEPTLEAERIGGLAFNQEVFILKESGDKRWQKVRLAEGELEGWIKAGNIERVND